MLIEGHYFPEQQRDEKVVRFARRHWMSFVWPWGIILGILFITYFVVVYILVIQYSHVFLSKENQEYFIISCSVILLSMIALFINAWTNYYLDVSILTTNHLVDIKLEGLFNRRVSEQTLLRVQDVSSRMRGIFQTFFHYGSVFVETAGDSPNFEMHNLPQPYKIANDIMKLHDQLVAKGGLYQSLGEADGVLKVTQQITSSSQKDEQKSNLQEKVTELKELEHLKDDGSIIVEKIPWATKLAQSMRDKREEKNHSKTSAINTKEKPNHKEGKLKEGEVIKL